MTTAVAAPTITLQNLGDSKFVNSYLDISGSTGDLMLSEKVVSGAFWKLTDHGDGKVSLQNLGDSKFKNWYIDISGSTGDLMLSEKLVSGAFWKLTDHGDGKISLQNLGDSKFKNWYLDISGSTGGLMLSEKLVSGALWNKGTGSIMIGDKVKDTNKIKASLEDYIKDHFAVGNERSASIEDFELRGEVLHFKVHVRSKEVKEIPVIGSTTVFSVTYHVEGDVNLINPDPDDVKICVDAPSPVNKICVTAREIAAVIMAA